MSSWMQAIKHSQTSAQGSWITCQVPLHPTTINPRYRHCLVDKTSNLSMACQLSLQASWKMNWYLECKWRCCFWLLLLSSTPGCPCKQRPSLWCQMAWSLFSFCLKQEKWHSDIRFYWRPCYWLLFQSSIWAASILRTSSDDVSWIAVLCFILFKERWTDLLITVFCRPKSCSLRTTAILMHGWGKSRGKTRWWCSAWLMWGPAKRRLPFQVFR